MQNTELRYSSIWETPSMGSQCYSSIGHKIHQLCNMEHDANLKRIKFIDNSTNIRETFNFADPSNILQAVQLYCGDAYGSMLWNLYGERACQYYQTWNTCAKLAWELPRPTHTYFIDNLVAAQFTPLRHQILERYVKFFGKLVTSQNDDVILLAELVGRDASSTTGNNISRLWQETGLNPWTSSPSEIVSRLSKSSVPTRDEWRLPYLQKLLIQRNTMKSELENTSEISLIIDELCIG